MSITLTVPWVEAPPFSPKWWERFKEWFRGWSEEHGLWDRDWGRLIDEMGCKTGGDHELGLEDLNLVLPGPETGVSSHRPGTIVMGRLGGRVAFLGNLTGESIPPSHIDNTGYIKSYSALGVPVSTNSDGNNNQPTYKPNFDAFLDYGNRNYYFGPHTYPWPVRSSSFGNQWEYWWPMNDWTRGLQVWITSGAAAGQYSYLHGRSPYRNNRFTLYYPFDTAPEEGDSFVIGPQLFWTIWGEQTAKMNPEALVQPGEGHVMVSILRGDSTIRVEIYSTGVGWELPLPNWPFRPDGDEVHNLELTTTMRKDRVTHSFDRTDSAGKGPRGYGVAAAVVNLVTAHNDFKYIQTEWEVWEDKIGDG